MNVQIHRAVTDLTGRTGMAVVRAIVAGERDPIRLAALRPGRCQKSGTEFAEYLTGNRRGEHLFSLASALHLYDAIQERIASYEARLLGELHALEPDPRRDPSIPEHPNPAKEKAIRNRGEQKARTTLWRFGGADLTRIDGIRTGATQVILTEAGLDLTCLPSGNHCVSWRCLSPHGPAHRGGGRRLCHRPQTRGPGLPYAPLRSGLRRYRRAGLNAAAQSLGDALIEREAASVRYQVIKINVLQPGFRSAIMIRVSWRGPRRTGKNQN